MHMAKWGAHYVRSLLRAHSLQQVHGGGGGDDDDDDNDIDGRVPRECCSHSLLPPPPPLPLPQALLTHHLAEGSAPTSRDLEDVGNAEDYLRW